MSPPVVIDAHDILRGGFVTPPEQQGQMVYESFASTSDLAVRRTTDRSEVPGHEVYECAAWGDLWDDTPEGEEVVFEPWNRTPDIPESAWRPARINSTGEE